MVNESNGIFLSIQKLSESSGRDLRPEMLQFSKHYRSILRDCIELLQDLMEKAVQDKKSFYSNLFTIFYNIECVWHLTEILYIDVIPGNYNTLFN